MNSGGFVREGGRLLVGEKTTGCFHLRMYDPSVPKPQLTIYVHPSQAARVRALLKKLEEEVV